jgi:CheY-like chemotaxis protein
MLYRKKGYTISIIKEILENEEKEKSSRKVLRSDDKTRNIKIIAISGDLKYTEAEVLGAGANSFLIKSVNFENLLSLCNEFLERPETLQ